jgi:hypothetical protein
MNIRVSFQQAEIAGTHTFQASQAVTELLLLLEKREQHCGPMGVTSYKLMYSYHVTGC